MSEPPTTKGENKKKKERKKKKKNGKRKKKNGKRNKKTSPERLALIDIRAHARSLNSYKSYLRMLGTAW